DAGLRLARKHVSWYSRGLPGSAEFRAAVNRLADAQAVIRLVQGFFDRLAAAGVTRDAARADNGPLPEAA
ncbi:MAG: tRNA dihydrouridine synthase DusB, partial [Acetobacteraceae bacterium]|nr:tRNA dihydrouridine synthase DusB [Acetobacteraceae bacterium]